MTQDRHHTHPAPRNVVRQPRWQWLVVFLILMLPALAQAVPQCSDVFPQAIRSNAQPPDVLTLPPFPSPNDGALNVPNGGTVNLGPGDYYFTSVNVENNATVNINGPVRIFVQGNTVIENNINFNNPGNPANLVVLAYSNATIGNNTTFNGILYAEGAVQLSNGTRITGAVTARGAVGTHPNTVATYDPDAVENADFGGLCQNEAGGPVEVSANGEFDSPVIVEAGEPVLFEAWVQGCPSANHWRDTWQVDGATEQGPDTSGTTACDRSPIPWTTSFSDPGSYEVTFISDYCTGFSVPVCNFFNQWQEHGRGSIIIEVLEPEIDVVIDYRMESTEWTGDAGEVIDSSGFDNHGTAINDPQTSLTDPIRPGDPGTCRYATVPTDGRINTSAPGALSTPNNMSVAFWFRAVDVGPEGSILALGDLSGLYARPLEILRRSEGNLRAVFTDQNDNESFLDHDTSAFSGDWVHIAVTRRQQAVSGGQQQITERLYLDGNLITENQRTQSNPPDLISPANIHIGGLPGVFGSTADYDDVIFANGALDPDELDAFRLRDLPCDLISNPDHIRLIHPGSGLTCAPFDVQVQACDDPDCTELFSEETEVGFVSPAGNWSQNPVSFTGQTTVSLQVTTPGPATLDAVSDPEADNPTRCFDGAGAETCVLDIADSGFLIDVEDHIAGVTVTGTLSAVRTDEETLECVAGFGNDEKEVRFWSDYANPGSGTAPISIEGSPVDTAAPGSTRNLFFDADGQAGFSLSYPDVGRMTLNAEYTGEPGTEEEGLEMTGSGQFIARPSHFELEIDNNPAAEGPAGPVFATAGVDFDIEVSARNANNSITPNFGNESPAEAVDFDLELVEPAGGSDPNLVGSFGAFDSDCDGNTAPGVACGTFYWPEVGIISLTPRLTSGAYLGSEDVVGQSEESIGRFIPDHFTVSSRPVRNRVDLNNCEAASFTYIGEPFAVDFTLQARNALGAPTNNYHDEFARLDADELDIDASPEPPEVLDADLQWERGLGLADVQLKLPRDAPKGPYPDYTVSIDPTDSDGVGLGSEEDDEVGTTELRFGRIVVDNAIGSELAPLDLPWRAEHWNGDTWQVNQDDDCTVMALADDVVLIDASGTESDGETSVSVGEGSTSVETEDSRLELVDGAGWFRFTAPDQPGWVDLRLNLEDNWPFLRDDLSDDDNYDDDPQGRASFGLFDGSPRRIFIQETAPR
ncbi:LamG domain-containing protein [Wenzhouxiangella sp. AB-CW3]|uniref:LamG domain-containing protein n=1 Tax=Wenzhouxiangella sp. AB-CW3 TaxID=2771012 RepID=UPI00168BC023|nr:LamG domain-containing protein [Wenzhouxiangella sp. AB-CW3]QOC23826.1 LamG domain-containing protein [Wenzhouxiangella sp. AB-CW3]